MREALLRVAALAVATLACYDEIDPDEGEDRDVQWGAADQEARKRKVSGSRRRLPAWLTDRTPRGWLRQTMIRAMSALDGDATSADVADAILECIDLTLEHDAQATAPAQIDPLTQ